MARIHNAHKTLTFSLGGAEHEFECELWFEFTPGMPETGAGYLADPYHYDPGSPDEIHITRAFMIEKGSMHDPLPGWMFDAIYGDEELHAALAESVRTAEAA